MPSAKTKSTQELESELANPYMGPHSYRRGDKHLFVGREQEADKLLSLIITEGVVLFYAQSGAGKSSLVNARLIPNLEARGFDVFPVVRIGGELPANISIDKVQNVYIFNLMWNLVGCKKDPKPLLEETLESFLATFAQTKKTEPKDKTHTRDDAPPDQTDTPDNVADDRKEVGKPRVLIIDQFEEILTAHQRCWEQRDDFFRRLDEALKADPLLSIMFVMREDHVAELDRYAPLLRGRLRARLRMEQLGKEDAIKAARDPAAKARRPFDPEVAEDLVKDLCRINVAGQKEAIAGEFVEPVQLQVVCFQLWEDIKESNSKTISKDDLKNFGEIDKALEKFYEDAIERVSKKHAILQLNTRRWFTEKLITPSRIRAQVNRERRSTGGLPNEVVESLVDEHLVRPVQVRGGTWYELVHDRFIEPILQANDRWMTKGGSPLSVAAVIWNKNERDPSFLYRGQRLREAQRWLKANESTAGQLEKEFVSTSNLVERKATKRLRRLAIGLGLALMVSAVALVFIAISFMNSQKQTRLLSSYKLAADAKDSLQVNPERSLLLALQSVMVTYSAREEVPNEARDALTLAIAQASQIRLTLSGHTKSVNDISFNPDQSLLATASEDGTAAIWDAFSGEKLQTLSGHTASVTSVAFSKDGERLATGSEDGTAKIWNPKSGQLKKTFTGHKGAVYSVAFNPDGTHLATASEDETAKVWKADSGEELLTLSGHKGPVNDVTFNRDGSRLATASKDGTAKVWDATSVRARELLGLNYIAQHTDQKDPTFLLVPPSPKPDQNPVPLLAHGGSIHTVAFSPDGKSLITGGKDGRAIIWDLDSGKKLRTLSGHSKEVLRVALSADGGRLATASEDGTVKLWDTRSISGAKGEAQEVTVSQLTLSGGTGAVHSVAFSPDGKLLATASEDKTARVWNAVLGHLASRMEDIAFRPDGRRLATVSRDGKVIIWDADSHRQLLSFSSHQGARGVVFSHDGRKLAVAGLFATIWNADFGQLLVTIKEPWVMDIDFNRDSSLVATAHFSGAARIWDANTGTFKRQFDAHSRVYAVAFSPDGNRLATAGEDKTAKVWDANSGQELLTFSDHSGEIVRIAFSSDGKHLATASGDKTAKVWDANSGDLLSTLSDPGLSVKGTVLSHDAPINDIEFGKDGKQLATADANGSVKLWDAHSYELKRTLPSQNQSVQGIAFSPDSKSLAAITGDKTVLIYPLDDEQMIALARAKITRPWTDEECRKYLLGRCPHTLDGLDSVVRANNLARIGDDVTAAIESLKEARHQNPALGIHPEEDATTLAAHIQKERARVLTDAGRWEEAKVCFRRAHDLISDSEGLKEELQDLESAMVQAGETLARKGNIREAIEAFELADALHALPNIPAANWNNVCWYGSLYDQRLAESVKDFCEKAVELDSLANFRDSRGLNRARRDLFEKAVEDFTVFTNATTNESDKARRVLWIKALQVRRNPFTEKVLAELRKE